MKLRVQLAVAAALLFTAACSSEPHESSSEGTWIGTITTEGNVTTVINEPGSVWGGTAKLVEEASIGVDVGEEPYMFGRPAGVYATAERIYVVDVQVPVVRVFDFDGLHLFSFGVEGQGPGEFVRPYSIGGSRDGRIFVGDRGGNRINVYTSDGEYLVDYKVDRWWCCVRQMVVTPDGVPYFTIVGERDPADPVGLTWPMQAFGDDGPIGEPIGPPKLHVERTTVRHDARDRQTYFSPTLVWKLGSDLRVIVGASHHYRFEVRHQGGSTLVVERAWDPIEVLPDEREWTRLTTIASRRRGDPSYTWDGAGTPFTKPAFEEFIAAHSGETWVVRPGPGVKDPECDDKHSPDDWEYHSEHWRCWRDQPLIDVFDAKGAYLGEVEVPAAGILLNSIAPPYIRGDTVVGALYEADGVIRVKRYRLVLPGER